MNKETLRKCIGCFQVKNREELIKITRESSTGEVLINPDAKKFGRSVYLCYNESCIKEAFKKNKLAKFLKTNLSDSLQEELQTFHKE